MSNYSLEPQKQKQCGIEQKQSCNLTGQNKGQRRNPTKISALDFDQDAKKKPDNILKKTF